MFFMSISTLFDTIQSNINIIVILIFASIPILIGSASATKSVSTVSDFFLCNRSLGTTISFFTIYASWWSSFAFLGSTSSFYFTGPIYWIALGWNVLFGILFMVFGKRIWSESNKHSYMTPIDFFSAKYHSPVLDKTILAIMVGLMIPYIAVQFLGGGIIIEMATNGLIPWKISTLIFFAIMIIYLWSGGLRAVVWTDALYAILIFIGMLLIGIIFVNLTGGIHDTFLTISKVNPTALQMPDQVYGINSYGVWISLLVVMPLGELMTPQIWIRIYAIKEEKTFHVLPFLLSLATLAYLGTMLAGNAALILEPDYVGQSDYLLPTMLTKYLPPLLMSFMMCCAATACLSTANSQLHSMSQLITLNIYKQHFNKGATEKHLVLVAKLIILLIAFIIYLILLMVRIPTIFNTVFMTFGGVAQLFVPFVGALRHEKPNADSALAGILAGITVTVVLSFWHPFTLPVSAGIIGLAVNALIFTLSSKGLEKNNAVGKKRCLDAKRFWQTHNGKRASFVWVGIMLCLFLMGSPIIVILDHFHCAIWGIPAVYVFPFAVWLILCVLTLIGYILKWGQKKGGGDASQPTSSNISSTK